MEEHEFARDPGSILALERWNWTNAMSAELSRALVIAVRDAEALGEDISPQAPLESEGSLLDLEQRGRWERAHELANELRAREPGPLPALVADALRRTDVAASVLGLPDPGDHEW